MTNKTFWSLTMMATIVSIVIATIVTLNFNWVLGLIVYFCVDFILDGLLVTLAIRQDRKIDNK